jgi:hypothetical protein
MADAIVKTSKQQQQSKHRRGPEENATDWQV